MELKIKELQIPEAIEFNYQEVKEWVVEGVEKYGKYKNMVMDADAVKIGKADRAELNKVKDALNSERLRQEREYMKPFTVFKDQVKELIGMIEEPVKLIDGAVKGYEEEQKKQKEAKIEAIFEKEAAESEIEIKLESIWNPKWLNSSVTLKKVQEEIKGRVDQINTDVATIQKLPEFAFEALETYKLTLDMNRAISEGQRLAEIQKRKAEAEKARLKAEEEARKAAEQDAPTTPIEEMPPHEAFETLREDSKAATAPAKQWIRFQAHLTVAQAQELKQFFDNRQIEFKAVSFDKEKAAEIMVSTLSYAYCDNCGKEGDDCDECHRKYQNWCLGKGEAESIVEDIAKKCL